MRISKYILGIVVSFLIVNSGIAQNESSILKEIRTYDNEVYGTIINMKLKEDAEINKYPVSKGKVSFYANDSLASFTLSADHIINGSLIPAGSRVSMYSNGNPEFIYIKGEAEIQGYKVSGTKKMLDWHASFYNNGQMNIFRIDGAMRIDGILCSDQNEIALYPDGNLWFCHLGEDIFRIGSYYPKETKVIFDNMQKMKQYTLAEHLLIREKLSMDKLYLRKDLWKQEQKTEVIQ